MKQIDIDDQVLAELACRATGFHVTPNDVLRRILDLKPQQLAASIAAPQPPPVASVSTTLVEFIGSERFRRHHQAVDRYLVILSWLNTAHQKQFADAVLGFHRGSRLYFAKSEQEILQTAVGSTAKPIPQSPYWALTTLDNKSKRIVLEDILRALSYSPGDSKLVLAELADSGIRRSHARAHLLASL